MNGTNTKIRFFFKNERNKERQTETMKKEGQNINAEKQTKRRKQMK